jgi:hypothetical protein
MSDKGLLEIAQKLVSDRGFRERFLLAPKDVLADLGVSAEAYRTLVAVLPVLLAAGGLLVDGGVGEVDPNGSVMAWGRP